MSPPASGLRMGSTTTASRPPRPGLTLLEVILALSLSTLLLGAALQCAYLAIQYRIRHDSLNRATNATSVLYLDIASDLHGFVSPHQSLAAQSHTANATRLSKNLVERIQASVPSSWDDLPYPSQARFWGNREAFLLHTHWWSPRLGEMARVNMPSETVTVVWWFSMGKAIQVEVGSDRLPTTLKTILPPNQVKGLVRTVLGRDSLGKETQESRLIAPDVSAIRFRFFDRVQNTWHDDWNEERAYDPALIESTVTIDGKVIRLVHGFAMDLQALSPQERTDLWRVGG